MSLLSKLPSVTNEDGMYTKFGAMLLSVLATISLWILIELVSWLNGITPWWVKLIVGIIFLYKIYRTFLSDEGLRHES